MMFAHATKSSPSKGQACPLWQGITARQLQTVAVMGMTKNTGKTVCLNHLLDQAHDAGRSVGLTSIGRDGEERDQVFFIPKPPVKVHPGCLVATARDTLLRAKVRTEHVGPTGVDSPMGEIVIVKAMEAGDMEVAGASRGRDQHKVIALLKQCGSQVVFLDGALGRSHHASPAMADGVVLATGAAIGGSMDDVLRKTRDRLAILSIAPAPTHLAQQVQAVFDCGAVGVWHRDGTCLFNEPIATLSAASALLSLRADDIGLLALPGAVGKLLWQAVQTLLSRHPGLNVVVADGTKLFIDALDLVTFERQGGRLYALRGIQLIGVALNPFSPFGGSFDAPTFLAQAQTALSPHVVTDVMLVTEGPDHRHAHAAQREES
ncbi:MAG: hypothetical protein ACM3VZ_00515 [Acidobacteriota bacterium]